MGPYHSGLGSSVTSFMTNLFKPASPAEVYKRRPSSVWGRKMEGISPTALFTGHRPLGVVLTVAEVRHEVVKPNNGTAAEHSVIAGNLQL